ncbi:MAG: hypothetical protein AB7P14_26030 [Blastocatellales bacterium]
MVCSFLAELFNWASIIIMNHNETMDIELDVEEVEEVVAPGIQLNHNETIISGNL